MVIPAAATVDSGKVCPRMQTDARSGARMVGPGKVSPPPLYRDARSGASTVGSGEGSSSLHVDGCFLIILV